LEQTSAPWPIHVVIMFPSIYKSHHESTSPTERLHRAPTDATRRGNSLDQVRTTAPQTSLQPTRARPLDSHSDAHGVPRYHARRPLRRGPTGGRFSEVQPPALRNRRVSRDAPPPTGGARTTELRDPADGRRGICVSSAISRAELRRRGISETLPPYRRPRRTTLAPRRDSSPRAPPRPCELLRRAKLEEPAA
jgi:hypothetical protein